MPNLLIGILVILGSLFIAFTIIGWHEIDILERKVDDIEKILKIK
jgi:hypothetical protein